MNAKKERMGRTWQALVSFGVLGALALGAFHSCARPRVAGKATVTVFDDGAPMPERWVVFHDEDGTPLVSLRTDAQGKATADIPAEAMVTVAYGESIEQLVTVTSVKPGDELVIGEKEDEGGLGETLSMAHVKLPPAHPGATRQRVTVGVGQTDARTDVPLVLPVLKRFVAEDRRFRVLGEAFDPNGKPLAFALGSAALETDHDAVDVPLPSWSTDWRDLRVVLARPPSAIVQATADLTVLAGEERFTRGRRETSVRGDTTIGFAVPRPLGSDALVRVELAYAGSDDRAAITERDPHLKGDELRLDLASAILPRVSAARAERTTDVRRPVVRWNIAGPAQADATIARLTWPATGEHVWTIVAPPQTTAVRVPALPRTLKRWAPDGRPVKVAVAVLEASYFDGYADVKKKGIAEAFTPPEDEGAVRLKVSSTGM